LVASACGTMKNDYLLPPGILVGRPFFGLSVTRENTQYL
jgi:hypothetical protein